MVSRYSGGFVVCPECGRQTHPLAKKILSIHSADEAAKGLVAQSAPASKAARTESLNLGSRSAAAAASASRRPVICANCGTPIGKLQTPQVWKDHLVCANCLQTLSGEARSPESKPAAFIPSLTSSTMTAATAIVRRVLRPAGEGTPLGPPASPNALAAMVRPEVQAQAGKVIRGHLIPVIAAMSGRGRVMLAIFVLFAACTAIYGALTLLRDLTGYLTTGALILLAAGAIYLLLRASVVAGRKLATVKGAIGRVAPANGARPAARAPVVGAARRRSHVRNATLFLPSTSAIIGDVPFH